MQSLRITMPQEMFSPAAYEHFEGEISIPVLKAGPDLYDFEGPLTWQVDVSNTGDALLVTGEVHGVAKTACARCLKEFSFPVVGEIEGYFLIDASKDKPDDLEEDEFDVLPEDKTIDFFPLISSALLLEFPLVPVCKEDCLGLCPHCGADLNEGPCGCEDSVSTSAEERKPHQPRTSNPFEVLKNYKFDN